MDLGLTDSQDFLTYRRAPWSRSAQALGISLGTKSLVLAALGLVLMQAGWWGLDQLFPKSANVTPEVTIAAVSDLEMWSLWRSPAFGWPGVASSPWVRSLGTFWPLSSIEGFQYALEMVAAPVRSLMSPFLAVFDPKSDGWGILHAALAAVWGVLVWGLLGGAIARIAVVRSAKGERIGLRSALGFALRKLLPLVGTPLCPFIAVAAFLVPCALLGLLYQVPGPAGVALAGVLMVFPLLAGLIVALMLVGLGAGWPLMVATVAAEGEDSFDALSRSYGYVYQRPGRYALSIVLAWFLGVIGLVVVGLFAALTVHLATWGLALGAPHDRLIDLLSNRPFRGDRFPASAHRFWLDVVGVLARGWVYSYFWTAAALIYLRLRLDVDGTPWNVVYQPEPPASSVPEPSPDPTVQNPTANGPNVEQSEAQGPSVT
ncbi:MAG: hypothetical protein ABI353_22720 [Isosphaeraceae bacterium]